MFQSFDAWLLFPCPKQVLSSNFACSCGLKEELSSVTGFLNEQMCFSHKLHSLIPQIPATMSSFVLKYLFFLVWNKKEIHSSHARTISIVD